VTNYRSQGLAKKICKTHRIVLTNRSKIGVRSEKDLGWIWGEDLESSRGFLEDSQDTRKLNRIKKELQGPN
jgi:hypothetical protein